MLTKFIEKRRWQLIAFLCVILPITIMAVFTYPWMKRNMMDLTLARRESLAYLTASFLEEKLDHFVDVGISLATRVKFRQLISQGEWDEAVKILEGIPRDLPYIERLFLADSAGILMADTPALPGVRGKNFAFRDWYKGVSKEWKPYVSEVYKRTAEPQYNVVAIAIPIKSEDQKLLGILVMQLKLDTLYEIARNIEVGPSGFAYMVDQRGQIVAHPKFPPQGEIVDFSSVPSVQKVLKGEKGVETLFNPIEKEERLTAYAPISKYGWGVIVQQPTAAALAVFNGCVRMLAIIYLGGFLLALFFAYFILRIIDMLNLERQREATFLESIGDGVVAIDRGWNITLFNQAASRISGWSKEEVMAKPLRDFIKFIRERDQKENIVFIEEAMLYGQVRMMEDETVLINKDGRSIPVGDTAAPIFDNRGRVNGAIIVFRDASKEREARALRSDFAYASHQLYTPVNKALWELEVALEEKEPAKIRENLEIAYESTKSVRKLADQLLVVSEIDQRTVVPKIEKARLLDIFTAVLKMIEPTALRQNIKITVSPVSPVLGINTDSKLLQKALFEILDNAVCFSPKNQEVKINATVKNNEIVIEIQDSGIGIPQEQQSLVFTKFFRGSNIPPQSVGAGLGLFIAREYVKLLKGRVWFKSEIGKGTTFSILLPINNRT